MTAAPKTAKRRLAALSQQLVAPIGDQGMFENIPVLKKIAPDSVGPRVKGLVVIVTGQSPAFGSLSIPADPDYRSQFSPRYWSSFSTSVRPEWREGHLHMRLQRFQPRDAQTRARVIISQCGSPYPEIRCCGRGGGKGGCR